MKVINDIKLYDSTEVCAKLETSPKGLTKLRKEGLLRFTKIGRSIYSSEEAINDYLNGIIPENARVQKPKGKTAQQSI